MEENQSSQHMLQTNHSSRVSHSRRRKINPAINAVNKAPIMDFSFSMEENHSHNDYNKQITHGEFKTYYELKK